MKFKNSSRGPARRGKTGFTLIEILVVIAIIAILAAFIVAAGQAINAAKRAKANVIANQIQTAILNYQTEYGLYPVPSATTADTYYNSTDSADQSPLMQVLCGNLNASTATTYTPPAAGPSNTRQIAYLTPKKTDVDANGILINPFSTTAAPIYFFISMDADYSGVLGDGGGTAAAPQNFATWTGTSTTATSAGTAKITQGVAIWACCDPNYITTPTTSKSPNLWVHTY